MSAPVLSPSRRRIFPHRGRDGGGRSVTRTVAAAQGVVILAFTALSLLTASLPTLWGWQPRVVTSGSMEPSISTGDLVMIGPAAPSELRPGLVVLADSMTRPGQTYLHRVVRVKGDKVVTRGDANGVDDYPALALAGVRGQARLVLPLMGWPMLWIQRPTWSGAVAGALTVVVLVAALLAARPLWKPPVSGGKRRRRVAVQAQPGPRGRRRAGRSAVT